MTNETRAAVKVIMEDALQTKKLCAGAGKYFAPAEKAITRLKRVRENAEEKMNIAVGKNDTATVKYETERIAAIGLEIAALESLLALLGTKEAAK